MKKINAALHMLPNTPESDFRYQRLKILKLMAFNLDNRMMGERKIIRLTQ
jgi:hypothetical protein